MTAALDAVAKSTLLWKAEIQYKLL